MCAMAVCCVCLRVSEQCEINDINMQNKAEGAYLNKLLLLQFNNLELFPMDSLFWNEHPYLWLVILFLDNLCPMARVCN